MSLNPKLRAIKNEAVRGGLIDHEKVSQISVDSICKKVVKAPLKDLTYDDLKVLLEYFQGLDFKKKPLVQKIDVEAGKKAIQFAILKLRQEIEASEQSLQPQAG
jgi:hypothetical protein